MTRILLILGGVVIGGGLWIGCVLRRQWRAPFEDGRNKYKHPALHTDQPGRIWNGDEWK